MKHVLMAQRTQRTAHTGHVAHSKWHTPHGHLHARGASGLLLVGPQHPSPRSCAVRSASSSVRVGAHAHAHACVGAQLATEIATKIATEIATKIAQEIYSFKLIYLHKIFYVE